MPSEIRVIRNAHGCVATYEYSAHNKRRGGLGGVIVIKDERDSDETPSYGPDDPRRKPI